MRKYYFLLFLLTFSTGILFGQKTNLGSKQRKVDYYLNKLQVKYNNGDYESFKIYSDSLYHFAKKNNLLKYQILGMVNQAVYSNNKGEQNKSILLYRNALSLTDSIPKDYRTKIIILVNLGNAYTNIKSHDKAIKTMKDVLIMLDEFEDNPKIRASAFNGLANNYDYLEDYDTSLEYHMKSKKLGEQIGDESIVITALNNITDTYQKQGNYEKAIETGKFALGLDYSQKQTKERASLLINLGLAEQQLGNIGEAINFLEDAKKLSSSKGLKELEMDCHKYLAEIYMSKNDNVRAGKANENYLILKNSLLENSQSATKLDLEKDISVKNDIIKTKESEIKGLQKTENRLLLWSGLVASVLIIVSLLFFAFRKRSFKEQHLLQEQFLLLKTNFESKKKITASNISEPRKAEVSEYKNSSLSKEDFTAYKQQLLDLMISDRPYLNSELSQSDLAINLGISSHHLSEILNNGFSQNFYNFINSYRVLEAQRLMKNDQKKHSKILAFAFDSGFKSKTSFNRVFKAHTGTTPSDYRKKLTS